MGALLQGMGMGLAIAAPVGPIGMLCVRRSLQDGAAAGLATGLGAAVADASYGCAVAGGLAISGWLAVHARALSVLGAALLAWMGVAAIRGFLARRHPKVDDAPGSALAPQASAQHTPVSVARAFASSFLLTIGNPATIVGFVGVVTAFGAAQGAQDAAFALVAGVFLGSMLWWSMLVGGVRAARRALPAATLGGIDLATGVVLLASGAWLGSRALAG